MWCHSLKKKDVGYCKKTFGERESVLLAERVGKNKKGSVLENTVNLEVIEIDRLIRGKLKT